MLIMMLKCGKIKVELAYLDKQISLSIFKKLYLDFLFNLA